MPQGQSPDNILILGLGNILLGDEGFGVHAVNYLKEKKLPGHIELLDGGTGGFNLLPVIEKYRKMILIDAASGSKPAGTVEMIKPRFSSDFPRALSTHDIGLKDLLETAFLLNTLPEVYLVIGYIQIPPETTIGLSGKITDSLPAVYEKVIEAIRYFRSA